MKALLIVSHGSRRQASNDEVRLLTNKVRDIAGNNFELVESAFLELAEPSIPDGIQNCIEKGATTVVVFPYFLAAGTHVADDIPSIIEASSRMYPDAKIILKPHLGGIESMARLISDVTCS